MSVLIERTGDIFTSEAPALAQGVNTKGAMGAGIAKQFRDRWPAMYRDYRELCLAGGLTPGSFMSWPGINDQLAWLDSGEPVIFNLASQNRLGADARLEWVRSAVTAALADAHERKLTTLALPQIGCGIGGLDWEDVLSILRACAESSPVDIEAWTYGR